MIIRKRQLLLATLIIALGAAVFVNWYYTRPEVESVLNSKESTTLPEAEQGANLGDAKYVISGDAVIEDTAAQAKANEYFAGAKLRRQTAHDEAAEALNDVIKDGNSSSEAVKKATEALENLTDSMTLECDIENLISAKIGCENLVILNRGNAEIVVENTDMFINGFYIATEVEDFDYNTVLISSNYDEMLDI